MFLAAAIYLCLARVIAIYGLKLSPIPPRAYTILFIALDFLSLLLQAGGGALAAIANDFVTEHTGIHIMIAGLALQVASLLLFIGVCGIFVWRVKRVTGGGEEAYVTLRRSLRFKGFLGGTYPYHSTPNLLSRSQQHRENRELKFLSYSSGSGHILHPSPLRLPRRRAERGLQRTFG